MNNVSHIPSYLSPEHLGPWETFLVQIDRVEPHLAPELRALAPILTRPMRALIVNGADPDEPERWQDRSRLVMHVLCEMIRADVPDGVMKAVILDPAYGISAHVRDQKGPERYADRQIQRALAEQPRPGPILVPVALNLARAYRDARRPNLRHHQQQFLDWDGAAYVGCADDTVRAEVWTF